jgi:hypothetical protein
MSKNDILITLIKEVVKNEVKQQLQEEIKKLLKAGKLTLPETKKVTNTPKTQIGGGAKIVNATGFGKVKENTKDVPYDAVYEYDTETYPQIPKKEYTKNAALNEILNQTKPFTAQERANGASPMMGMMGGSVLDSIQRESEEDWGTIKMDTSKLSAKLKPAETTPEGVDAVTKALTRDYSELVKRFK